MGKSSRIKNTFINFISGICGQLFAVVVRFVTRTVFIYTLGKSFLGINGLFSDILSMLSLTELGIDTAINFKLYKPLAERDEARVRVLMKFYETAYRVVGATILVLGLCLVPALPFLIKDYDSIEGLGVNPVLIFLIYLAQSVFSYLFWASRGAIVRADQKGYLLDIAGFVLDLVKNITQIIILVVFCNFIAYSVIALLFTVIQIFVNAKIAKHYYPYAFEKTKDRMGFAEVKDTFKDLGSLVVYKVNGVILKATDNIVLSSFIGLAIVGIYSNYLIIYTTITNMVGSIYRASTASIGNLYASEGLEKNYSFFQTMNFLTAMLYGTACVGVGVVANELIYCWIGDGYLLAQPFPILVGIEILFVGLKTNLGNIRNTTGAFRQMWFRPIISVVVNLVVSIALVQKLGIYGVIIGTLIADFSTNLLLDPYILHKYSFKNYRSVWVYYRRNIGYLLLLVLIGAFDYLLCGAILPNITWFSVIVHVIICGLSVPAVFLLVYRKRPETKYLLNIIKGFATRICGRKHSK